MKPEGSLLCFSFLFGKKRKINRLHRLFKLVFWVCIGLLVDASSQAQAESRTVRLRMTEGGYRDVVDLAITTQHAQWSSGNGRVQTDPALSCFDFSEKGGYEARVLLRFSHLERALPENAKITEATLTLTLEQWSTNGGPKVRGYYLRVPFSHRRHSGQRSEGHRHSLGWLYRDGQHPWSQKGALGIGTDVQETPTFVLGQGEAGQPALPQGIATVRVPLDKGVVSRWVKHPRDNHGILLVNEVPAQVLKIFSSRAEEVEKRPLLSITYETAQGTPAPVVTTESQATPKAPKQPARRQPLLILSQPVLQRLRDRATKGDPAWQALSSKCSSYLGGDVEWPRGLPYPKRGSIGQGYQGSDYFEALVNLGLCYQVASGLASPIAHRFANHFAEKGVDVLVKMSEVDGPKGQSPLQDKGYGIRFYGVGLALGLDWFAPALSSEVEKRIHTALRVWISSYEKAGFGRNHPMGNYYAGYYAAKGLYALVSGEESLWQEFLDKVHRGYLRPYFATNLAGGGWPEGLTYGTLSTLNFALIVMAAQTARGVDLISDEQHPFRFPLDQASYLLHFTWPSLRTMDDRGTHHSGVAPAAAQPILVSALTELLRRWRNPLLIPFRAFASQVRTLRPEQPMPAWAEFLFWEQQEPTDGADALAALPKSYLARGLNQVALRSGFSQKDGVWGSFGAGTYIGNPAAAEQLFDQGSLVIVRGDRPLLVNAPAHLLRHTPGTEDGRGYDDFLYRDFFSGNRTLFNIFYVDRPARYGQDAIPPDLARTRISIFEDGGADVVVRGVDLADMYRPSQRKVVGHWERTIVYLRPQVFVVSDQTTIQEEADQWMAFHVPASPEKLPPLFPGSARYLVGGGASYAGVVTTLLPKDHEERIVGVFLPEHERAPKVFRLEVRPPKNAPRRTQWLTVVDAAPTPDKAWQPTLLTQETGNLEGPFVGTFLRDGAGEGHVTILGTQERPSEESLRYIVPPVTSRHVLCDLPPGKEVAVTVKVLPKHHLIRVSPGKGLRVSSSGILRFLVTATGTLRQ